MPNLPSYGVVHDLTIYDQYTDKFVYIYFYGFPSSSFLSDGLFTGKNLKGETFT